MVSTFWIPETQMSHVVTFTMEAGGLIPHKKSLSEHKPFAESWVALVPKVLEALDTEA